MHARSGAGRGNGQIHNRPGLCGRNQHLLLESWIDVVSGVNHTFVSFRRTLPKSFNKHKDSLQTVEPILSKTHCLHFSILFPAQVAAQVAAATGRTVFWRTRGTASTAASRHAHTSRAAFRTHSRAASRCCRTGYTTSCRTSPAATGRTIPTRASTASWQPDQHATAPPTTLQDSVS